MIITTPVRVRPGRVLALGGLSSFGPLALDFYLPGLPTIAADLQTTESAVQLSLSACMIGLALGQLIAGPLTDRIGRRRMLLLGVTLFAATAALCAFAPSIEVLLALRLLGGLGGGAGIVIARSMARDLYHGPTLARVFALLMLVSGMTPVIGPLLGGQLLRVTDWRGVFAALAAIGVLLLVTALAQPETLPAPRRRTSGVRDAGRELRGLLRDRLFLLPTLVLALGLCAMFTYIAMGSFVLQQVYGLDAQTFAMVSAGNALGIMLFAQASAVLVPKVGARALLTAGVVLALAAAGVMLLGVLFSESVLALLLPLFVMVGCTGLVSPNATALALDRQGELAGSASAVVGVAQFSVAAVVPPLASLHGVSPLVMAFTAVTTAAAAAVVHVFALRSLAARSRAARTSAAPAAPTAERPLVLHGPAQHPSDEAGWLPYEPVHDGLWERGMRPEPVRLSAAWAAGDRADDGYHESADWHRMLSAATTQPNNAHPPRLRAHPDLPTARRQHGRPQPDGFRYDLDPADHPDPGRLSQDDVRRREWRRIAERVRRGRTADGGPD